MDDGCTTDKESNMPSLERARAKHNEYVERLNKLNAKREKLLDGLTRVNSQRSDAIRAVTRSGKRIEKLVAAKTHTSGPTATVKPDLIKKVDAKPTPAATLNDPVPNLGRKRKSRRTPDDFSAEMKRRKGSATDGPVAD
jgi:hypothetical protein